MTYSLLLSDGSSFSLNGDGVQFVLKNSMTLTEMSLQKSSNIIERSYGDGSVKIGSSRLAASVLTLIGTMVFQDDADARITLNNLLSALNEAEYLVDETSGLRTPVDLSSPVITWEDGSYLRNGELSVELTQLVPYWEASEPIVVDQSVEAGVPIDVDVANIGYADVPFSVSVTVADQVSAVEYVEIQNIAEGHDITIESESFGLEEYTQLIVDTGEGTAYLLNEEAGTFIDAQGAFPSGSGYFNLLRGVNTLALRCAVDATFSFSYRPRYFV